MPKFSTAFSTAGYLKTLIKDLPDDAPILLSGSDHSYYGGTPYVELAAYSKEGGFSEYFDDENLDETETKVKALIIR